MDIAATMGLSPQIHQLKVAVRKVKDRLIGEFSSGEKVHVGFPVTVRVRTVMFYDKGIVTGYSPLSGEYRVRYGRHSYRATVRREDLVPTAGHTFARYGI